MPVATDVDEDPAVVATRRPALEHGASQLVHRREGLALGPDQQAQVGALTDHVELDGPPPKKDPQDEAAFVKALIAQSLSVSE